jgi:hypothetical protein
MDVTDDPDPRPSPLGDMCPECRAAGKQRPFEAAGLTLNSVMKACCRFCKGDHWAMKCTGPEAEAFRASDPYYRSAWKPKMAATATPATAATAATAATEASPATASTAATEATPATAANGATAETAVKVGHHIW